MGDTIYLRVGTEDRITFPAFIDSLRNFLSVLQDLDASISRDSRGSMNWEVVSLEKNSPPVIGVAPMLRKGHQDISGVVQEQVIENTRLLSSGGERTRYLSDAALDKFEKLASRSKRQGPMAIYINGDGGPIKAKADITEITYNNVRQLTAVKYSAYGSVFGSLDSISVHKGNEFRVWNETTNKPIRCSFNESELDRVKSYLGQRVMVAGIVQSNAVGNPISIRVDDLAPTAKRTLPTIEEMSGFIKDFTEGKSLKDYMEQLSDE